MAEPIALLAFWKNYDRKMYLQAAQLADELGYHSFWLPEAWGYEIFSLLATPSRHLELDGSGMLRGTEYEGQLHAVGDVFLMRMHNEQFGDYVMRNVVVEFEPDRRIAWAPTRYDLDDDEDWEHRWGFTLEPDGAHATVVTETYDLTRSPQEARRIMRGGTVWLAGMERTLERIDAVTTGSSE